MAEAASIKDSNDSKKKSSARFSQNTGQSKLCISEMGGENNGHGKVENKIAVPVGPSIDSHGVVGTSVLAPTGQSSKVTLNQVTDNEIIGSAEILPVVLNEEDSLRMSETLPESLESSNANNSESYVTDIQESQLEGQNARPRDPEMESGSNIVRESAATRSNMKTDVIEIIPQKVNIYDIQRGTDKHVAIMIQYQVKGFFNKDCLEEQNESVKVMELKSLQMVKLHLYRQDIYAYPVSNQERTLVVTSVTVMVDPNNIPRPNLQYLHLTDGIHGEDFPLPDLIGLQVRGNLQPPLQQQMQLNQPGGQGLQVHGNLQPPLQQQMQLNQPGGQGPWVHGNIQPPPRQQQMLLKHPEE